jgi:hypothetical protein
LRSISAIPAQAFGVKMQCAIDRQVPITRRHISQVLAHVKVTPTRAEKI